jgi:DNA-binding transcriptional LysR family regulator
MTLEQLRVFAAVAERLHMTQAARALNMTQSAASAAVAALETRHGVRLFDRVGRSLKLTEAGGVFLPEAQSVLARADAAALALDDLAGLRRGAIALAASQTVANYWLPARMAAFAASHPRIALKLTVGNTAQVAQAVLDGAADLGFIEGEAASPRLARSRIGSDRISIYVAPTHPLAESALAGAPLELADLMDLTWARREPGSGTRSEFDRALAARGVDTASLRVALELSSNEAVLEAAASGDLAAAVSDLAARSFVAAGRLQRLRFDLPERHLQMVTPRERTRSPAVAAFMARAQER